MDRELAMNYVLMNANGECLKNFTGTGWKSTRGLHLAKVFDSEEEAFQCALEINRVIRAIKMRRLTHRLYFVPYTTHEALHSRNALNER